MCACIYDGSCSICSIYSLTMLPGMKIMIFILTIEGSTAWFFHQSIHHRFCVFVLPVRWCAHAFTAFVHRTWQSIIIQRVKTAAAAAATVDKLVRYYFCSFDGSFHCVAYTKWHWTRSATNKTKMHLLLAEYYVVSGLGNYLPSRSLTLILFHYGENNEVNSNRIKKCNHIFARIAII